MKHMHVHVYLNNLRLRSICYLLDCVPTYYYSIE